MRIFGKRYAVEVFYREEGKWVGTPIDCETQRECRKAIAKHAFFDCKLRIVETFYASRPVGKIIVKK